VHNIKGESVARFGVLLGSMTTTIWERFLETRPELLVLYFAVLAIVVAVAAYAIARLRGASAQQEPKAGELLSKFREMHSRGELSDAEFREIKTTLAAQLRKELKDDGQTG
jgi:hypothetical protein